MGEAARPFSGKTANPPGAAAGRSGFVFDIQRYAIHDGPGIRTTVFLNTLTLLASLLACSVSSGDELARSFAAPPDSARPWVYWFWMDGNLNREGMTADLEAMKAAGIGGMIIMEVDVGIPRGPVKFMSPEWQTLFAHASKEAERLGLQITVNAGPGWTGTGGPWVKPEQSMQHLVASETTVEGPRRFDAVLPRPQPRKPYFGENTLTPELKKAWQEYYRDVAVLAFPAPEGEARVADLDEKALVYRAPYSSLQPHVKPYLPAPAGYSVLPAAQCVARKRIVDLTSKMDAQGRLVWEVPAGRWTIMRFVRTSTGQNTRPAPVPGLGFESDKFDPSALDAHFEAFVGSLLRAIGPRENPPRAGLTSLHIDSWEMGSQNWSERFADEFPKRRGYDPLPFLPVMAGRVVDSIEISERFLWDVRQTAQELIVQNHALHLRELGQRHGLGLSIEPYDMNPCSDLSLGSAAEVPMCEFWAKGHGFSTEFSCIEAISIAHALGRPVVAAESFTAGDSEAWRLYPGAMKDQGDWALCAGVNRIVFHRYAHQPWLDRRPGMTMGPYGVHWDRTQSWWDLVPAYHRYLARSQFLLRQGRGVADIAYLALEGAPHVFRPPPSALTGTLPDRREYNFVGLAPEWLTGAGVKDGRIVLPSGASYRVLVLPASETMTPGLLKRIGDLVKAGATVVGPPPRKSPSLSGHPACDGKVQALAREIWGEAGGDEAEGRAYGAGRIFRVRIPSSGSAAESPLRRLGAARWIWYTDGNPAVSAPVGTRFFRREVTVEPKEISSATIHITADNSYCVKVNGNPAAEGDDFRVVAEADVASLLRPGANRIEIEAVNVGDSPNPAGLVALVRVSYADGRIVEVPTDGRWQTALAAAADDADWSAARDLGPAEMGPWGPLLGSGPQSDSLYPPYGQTAAMLGRLGLKPDFASNGPIRYTHRQAEGIDLYFVSNRGAATVEAECTFRIEGRKPECWDPLSGSIRDLPDFLGSAGSTTVPLRFEPHQSYFIVFRKPAEAPGAKAAKNFLANVNVVEIRGPWEVRFDLKLGGPGAVTFETLDDWSKRPEEGIRHYSGVATYRTHFDLPAGTQKKAGLRIALGEVRVMARVRLNGKDLGTVWCAPWSVETGSAAKEKGNELEIDVANLWPNRLIGDQALPAEKRVSWTTWNPYKKDSALMPSGLQGPVVVQAEATKERE